MITSTVLIKFSTKKLINSKSTIMLDPICVSNFLKGIMGLFLPMDKQDQEKLILFLDNSQIPKTLDLFIAAFKTF